MDDRFYKDNQSSKDKRRSFANEPKYEIEPDTKDYDDLFSQRSSQKPTNPKNAKFVVSIPDHNENKSDSSQSRVPKGKPVGNSTQYTGFNNSIPSERTSPNDFQRPYLDSKQLYPAKQSVNSSSRPHVSQSHPPINGRPPIKRKKKKKTGKRIAISIISLFLVALLALFGYGYSILGKINYDSSKRQPNQYISSSELMSSDKVKNILFIGSDARSEISGMRSDTMMLCSIDKVNKKIKLTSFLRDSYVKIPSTGAFRKLNAACSSGGQQLVIDTIEYNFKVKIDSYILVDFEAFTKFIDALGGLDIDGVTEKEANYLIRNVKGINIKPGKNHLTGGAALWYSRIRYLDNDFYRTERQRKVISALISQVSHTNPKTLFEAVELIMPMISTDISRNEFINLGVGALLQYLHYDIEQHQIPADGTWSNARVRGDGAVLKMNIDENVRLLKEFIYS